jgi:hypothetical protein
MGYVDDIKESFLSHPILTLLSIYTRAVAVLLLPITFFLIVQGVTPSNEAIWLGVIAFGISISMILNVFYPTYDRVMS